MVSFSYKKFTKHVAFVSMKKFKFLIWLLCAFFIGAIYAALIYQGIWTKWGNGLSSLPIYMYFVWLIVVFYVSLTLHELGHLLSFVFQGVKIRALYITMFIFYKTDKGWRFKINPKLWVLLGGLVVPDLEVIDSDEVFEKIKKKFSNALIAAPIVTIVLWVVTLISFILVLLYSNHLFLIGSMTMITIYLTLLTLLYVHTFRLSNPLFYGDFVAYNKMKEDPIFQAAQIGQYTMFSLKPSKETDTYFFHQATSLIKKTSIHKNISHMALIQIYLEGVIYDDMPFDHQVDIKIQRFPVNQYLHSEQSIVLLHDICLYYYKLNRPDKAYQLYLMIKDRAGKKVNPEILNFLNQRLEHVMHIAYHEETLKQGKKYLLGNMWIFDSLLDIDDIFHQMTKKLPFVVYETNVHFDDPKEEKKGDD